MKRDPFFDLFRSYEFAVSEAKLRVSHEQDCRLQRKGKGSIKGQTFDELNEAGNEKRISQEKKRRINALLKAVRSLDSENDILDLAWQIDEKISENHPTHNPINWHRLTISCEAILADMNDASRKGRAKDMVIEVALECFISYRIANGLPISAFMNAGIANETVKSAQAFLKDVSFPRPIADEALAKHLNRMKKRQKG